eukprot:scaffold1070_cov245-Pinguiococcus_pyrenoidosus.AAC.40
MPGRNVAASKPCIAASLITAKAALAQRRFSNRWGAARFSSGANGIIRSLGGGDRSPRLFAPMMDDAVSGR